MELCLLYVTDKKKLCLLYVAWCILVVVLCLYFLFASGPMIPLLWLVLLLAVLQALHHQLVSGLKSIVPVALLTLFDIWVFKTIFFIWHSNSDHVTESVVAGIFPFIFMLGFM